MVLLPEMAPRQLGDAVKTRKLIQWLQQLFELQLRLPVAHQPKGFKYSKI